MVLPLEALITDTHEDRADNFVGDFKSSVNIDGEPIGKYLVNNYLRYSISVSYIDSGDDATVVRFFVSLCNLNRDPKLLEDDFQRMAMSAQNTHDFLKGSISDKKLGKVQTGQAMFDSLWEEHEARVTYLTDKKRDEIRELIDDVLVEQVTPLLSQYGAQILERNINEADNTLLEYMFQFS